MNIILVKIEKEKIFVLYHNYLYIIMILIVICDMKYKEYKKYSQYKEKMSKERKMYIGRKYIRRFVLE